MNFSKEHSILSQLEADPITDNSRRQVANAFYSFVSPKLTSNPKLIHVSRDMMKELNLTEDEVRSNEFLLQMTGNSIPKNSKPYAMVYAGHQFGNWAGQLGDGRAINLGEVKAKNTSWVIQLKGAGETPYSRMADGLAVLRSSIREYLCSEAMFHLGVPTTRALSLALSGDQVMRDMFYDGNPNLEPGAIVSRVAPSFIRFGNFELFAWRRDLKNLKVLADYTLHNFFPDIDTNEPTNYVALFKRIADLNLKMVIQWYRVGFVHGVMNTDNMSILGLTIDYGPYGWLEGYDPHWTPNTTDSQFKRYRFGNQGHIVLWNLYQLANALFPLVEDTTPFQDILDDFSNQFKADYLSMMRAKIGLQRNKVEDRQLIKQLEHNLMLTETDYTIFFRSLSDFEGKEPKSGFNIIKNAFYDLDGMSPSTKNQWEQWFIEYSKRLEMEELTDNERATFMNDINPKYVLRNYMAQMAIDEAYQGNYKLIDELFELLRHPYQEQNKSDKWYARRPEWARHKAGCSMLSCSS